jgi:hypothetical protein
MAVRAINGMKEGRMDGRAINGMKEGRMEGWKEGRKEGLSMA